MEKSEPWAKIPQLSDSTIRRGRFQNVVHIASGGMAHIFRATQGSLDRFVVVKKLKTELQHPETLERFRREARALSTVLHQNIAHVYDFYEEGDETVIVMEHIDGIDLSQLLEKIGPLPIDVAASILLSIARGLSTIHARRLVHRDIKPSNIRMTTRGEVKLMDFGIVMDIENTGLTRPGVMVGSPSYLSPEQVLGEAVTEKSDLFLLGICLYEMLTGVRPFKDQGKETVFQRIRKGQYVAIRALRAKVPKPLSEIITRCLELKPSERPKSVKELIVELEAFLGPQKASHVEDIILKFLDDEALLVPSVSYWDVRKKRETPKVLMWIALGLFCLALGFGLGRWTFRAESISTDYPPPKPLKK